MPKTPPGETRAKIHQFVSLRILAGEPPSVREVQDEFGFRSSATARQHLEDLVDSGALRQDSGKDRGYRIPAAERAGLVPILGRIHAGSLVEAIETAEGYVPVMAAAVDSLFALTVVGESMSGREIHDGDVILVDRVAPIKIGDAVVARIGDEATIKTYTKNGRKVVLKAENPDYQDIVPEPDGPEFELLGRVVEVRKRL